MSDIKAMMKAAQDKEDEVLAKFNEFDLDGSRGIDEVRTRTPSHRHEAAPVGRQTRIRCYRRAHAAVHAAARVIATESRALNFPPDFRFYPPLNPPFAPKRLPKRRWSSACSSWTSAC